MIKAITPTGKEVTGIYKIEFYSPEIIFVNDDIIVKKLIYQTPNNEEIEIVGDINTIKKV